MYDENYQVGSRTSSALAACLANVYWWMTFALLVSGVTAWAVGTSAELSRMVFQNKGIFIILILAELGMVFWISAGINKMQASTATALFIAYAVLNGITLSFIFLAYSMGSIAMTFAERVMAGVRPSDSDVSVESGLTP